MPSEEYALQTFEHFVKLSHVFAGVYIWEFVTTFGFEWEVFTGLRPWRWSFIVYVTARVLALVCIITSLVGFNVEQEFNCDTWLRFVLFTAWFAACSASLLIVLRSIAIWGRDIRIVILTVLFWLVNLAGACYALTRGHVVWSPALKTCALSGTREFTTSLTINFVEDFVLLSVMFLGVLHKRTATYLWNMLYFQALFWILAATFTELPSVVLGFMNINDAWNLMFQFPHLTLVVITASRAYRDIFQYITDEQNSYAVRRGRRPRGMQVRAGGQDVQVAVTKMVEFDVELGLNGGRRALRGRATDEESEAPSSPLTEEEQQIRTLELQMMHDLGI